MIQISLTNEQAEWLKEHLNDLLDDAHWNRGVLSGEDDAKEHAQTIHDKTEKELKSKQW